MIEQDRAQSGAAMSGVAPVSAWPEDGLIPPLSPPSPSWWDRHAIRGATLQWWAGLLCASIGAQMLIVPHQMSSQTYDAVRSNIALWGGASLLVGMTMLAVAMTGGARWLVLAAHAGVGVVMLLLASVFASSGAWFGAAIFTVLGGATLVAPWLARAARGATATSDLFTISIGIALGVVGVLVIALPDVFVSPLFDWMRPHQLWYGLSLIFSGVLVVVTQRTARTRWWLRWLAALLLVGIFVLPMFGRSLLQQLWAGATLYGICAAALISAPWLGPRLDRIDPRSLRTRLSTTLAISSALAVSLIVTMDANRAESSLRTQASASQQTLATALGHDVADYVELHEAAARALAAGPSLLDRPAQEQEAWLRAYSTASPNAVVFSTFDASGQQLARSDGRPLSVVAGAAWFERVRATLQPGRVVARSTSIQRRVFGYTAPVRGPNGEFRGVVASTIESSRIADQLRQVVADPSRRAYLVDSQGRTIAHPDVSLVASFADLSALQPVAALLGGDALAGSLVYTAGSDEWLAGHARVPELGWGVVVEQPTSVALASVRIGRERAFAALIVVVCLAAAIGAVAAGWLTAPLAVLSLAVRRLADGASDARLGSSGITEIARLAGAFGEMRERLAARTLEHERSELALRESEERLRLALQAGRMGTWDWSVRTNELTWDGSLEEIHGLPPGSFDGRFETFTSILHPEDREQAIAAIDAALRSGGQFNVEFRVVWPDGSTHWVAGLGRAYYDAQGEPIRMVGIGLEVTEQRRVVEVQRVLAEAGSQLVSSLDYETILRGVAQLVATTMADYCVVEVQDEDGARSVEVAHADAEMAAHARDLLSGLQHVESPDGADTGLDGWPAGVPLDGTVRGDWNDRSVLVPSVSETTVNGACGETDQQTWSMRGDVHAQLARALGARSLICVPLLARERTIGALTLIAAQSGRRYGHNDLALAEALATRAALAVDNARLYSEAQAAVRSRDEFLSIASHELRTPVTGIKGYSQLLLRAQERNRLEPARLTRSLHAIDDATDRLTTLTQDLLDVSRIRLGQLPLRLQEIDLAELVRRVSDRFGDQLPASHELIVDIRSPVPAIQGDADRLEQVLSNLIENAIKYSPDGGPVRIELGRAGEKIVLTVRDEGIGLPSDAAESIFKPFGRAPNAAQQNLPGMGLGLYICQNIVERHGGRITARSVGEGLGTTLEIVLPCPPEDPTPSPSPARGGEHVSSSASPDMALPVTILEGVTAP